MIKKDFQDNVGRPEVAVIRPLRATLAVFKQPEATAHFDAEIIEAGTF